MRFWGRFDFGGTTDSDNSWVSDRLIENTSSCSPFGRLKIAGNFGIYNQAQLRRELGFFDCEASDEALAAAAYLRWDTDCPKHLEGDFAFAILHETRGLFLCVDHVAAKRIFYFSDSEGISFASDVDLLLRMPDVPREPNYAQIVAGATPGFFDVPADETLHKAIFAVPGGQWIRFTRSGHVERGVHWEPETIRGSISNDPRIAFEDLRSRLFQSVDGRLRTARKPCILLSGGLDSSAIAAAGHAAQCARPITALTAVVAKQWESEFGDERAFALETGRHLGMDVQLVDAGGRGPFDDLPIPQKFETAFQISCLHYQNDALNSAAAAGGVDLILHGEGGEAGITYPGNGCLTEWLVRFHWLRLARELTAYSRITGRRPHRILGSQMLNCFAPNRKWGEFPWFTTGFLNQFRPVPAGRTHSPLHRPRNIGFIRFYIQNRHPGRPSRENRVPKTYPLLDRRILEWCLAAPADLKWRDGYNRYPVRGALRDLLPPNILWRTSKLGFAPDYSRRYNSQLGKAAAFLEEIGPCDPVREIVDINKLKKALRPLEQTPRGSGIENSVPQAFYLICFLRQFSGFR